jgi:hypothetical protein
MKGSRVKRDWIDRSLRHPPPFRVVDIPVGQYPSTVGIALHRTLPSLAVISIIICSLIEHIAGGHPAPGHSSNQGVWMRSTLLESKVFEGVELK